jgi:hypothetical protein
LQSALFESAIAEILDQKTDDAINPLLTTIKFIFADDQGNENRQGIMAEDFDEIINTAANMPIKMRYLGNAAGGHPGSVPIGHITKMEKEVSGNGVNQLIAWAVLYTDEYPNEINFLRDAFNKGEGPGISWELLYGDSIVDKGIQWLKGIITKAATFVRAPAYGKRTALLALAQTAEQNTPDFVQDLVTLAREYASDISVQGGKSMTEEEIQKLQEEVAAAKAEAERLTAANAELIATNGELTAKLTAAVAETETLKHEALAASREKAWLDAGLTLDADAEKASTKREFLASLSEEVFTQYLSDIKEVKNAQPKTGASASLATGMPKLAVAQTGKGTTLDDLKNDMREIARS